MGQPITLSDPLGPGGGGQKAPRPRDLVGCLVLYVPKAFTAAGAPGNTEGYKGKNAPRDRVTADLYIVETANGQPVAYGGYPDVEADPKPHDRFAYAPSKYLGAWITNSNMVRDLAPNGQPRLGEAVGGRIVRSTQGQNPFNLVKMNDADRATAAAFLAGVAMSSVAFREPTDLQGRPLLPDAPAQAAAAPAPQVQYQAAAAPPVIPQPAAPGMDPAALAAIMAQFGQAAPVAAPVAAPPPPGFPEQAWSQLNPAQKAQVYQSMGLATPPAGF